VVEAHFQLGLSMLELGRPDVAAQAFGKATSLRPEIADFHLGLGHALEALGRVQDARKCFERASKLKPQDLPAQLSLTNRLLREDDVYGARFHAQAALSAAPNSADAHLAVAEVAMLAGEGSVAEEHIRRALALDPKSSFAYAYLGLRLSHKGDVEEAETVLRRSIELRPGQGFSYLALVQANKETRKDRDFLAKMEAVRERAQLAPHEMASLNFALAMSYESLGEYARAMRSYDEANRFAHTARYGDRVFDNEAYGDYLKAIRELFPSGKQGIATESDLPIFIVGMIRSGTTLTEQILSSHPEVAGAGELLFWQRHAETPQLMAEILSEPERARRLTENYLRDLRQVSADARYVTDKLPANYQRVGLLRELFPNAKIIHCMRQPIDNVLSIYVTPNRNPSADRAALVFSYRQYQEMMRYWREILPSGSILDVQYEDLVSDPAPEIRRMLEFCGLEWNEACLSPEANSKEITTPSLWQARQPINRNSVERWRRFEPWLGEFRELLEG
jgi:tetratricopeptide (TPR) repeat protein